mmetsp:Transcript_18537/g.53441  ORF Transcript_18537/g.53441 Transcript_18537/m.53441 type:complete len:438 (-) Transcript_18537:63-1376(-)
MQPPHSMPIFRISSLALLLLQQLLLTPVSVGAFQFPVALAPATASRAPSREAWARRCLTRAWKTSSAAAAKDSDDDGVESSKFRPKVLCVGDALFDCIANDDARGVSVAKMVERNAWTPFPGGANANVATALCRLGTPSAFCGCVGSDEDGDVLENLFRETGVDVTMLRRADEGIPTRRVMVTRSIEGDREFGGFYGGLPSNTFSDCFLDISTVADDASDAVVEGVEWLVCGTLGLACEKSAEATRCLINRAVSSGASLCLDVNWRPVFWPEGAEERARDEILALARQAQVVKLTDEEAEWLLDIPAEDALKNPFVVHEKFPDASAVLVTAGEKGASYYMVGHEGFVEPFVIDVVETTGAGDAFTAGFLHGLLSMGVRIESFEKEVGAEEQAEAIESLLRFASATGALTCTKEGAIAAQPSYDQVESFLIHGKKVWV